MWSRLASNLRQWLVKCPQCSEVRLVVGAQENDQYVCEDCGGKEKVHPLNNLPVEITARVKNNTGRKINGLEMRGAIRDAQNSTVRERTVVVIPVQQTVLEVDEAINVRILLESIDKGSDRAHAMMEVTGIRFD